MYYVSKRTPSFFYQGKKLHKDDLEITTPRPSDIHFPSIEKNKVVWKVDKNLLKERVIAENKQKLLEIFFLHDIAFDCSNETISTIKDTLELTEENVGIWKDVKGNYHENVSVQILHGALKKIFKYKQSILIEEKELFEKLNI